jgi:hypothetical protein
MVVETLHTQVARAFGMAVAVELVPEEMELREQILVDKVEMVVLAVPEFLVQF